MVVEIVVEVVTAVEVVEIAAEAVVVAEDAADPEPIRLEKTDLLFQIKP